MWDYDEALAWLYARQAIGIKLGLDKVREMLRRLGDPQKTFCSVHVAGTNGKGSVVRFVAAALALSGHRTGTFTSPHLVSFTERIRVGEEAIPRAAVAQGLAAIRPVVEALDAEREPPTFFEVNTALAFWWFREQDVAWAVVETGMGGRLDATNVLEPAVTVITNVAADHEAYLGSSVAEITYEKAGIMKRGVPCVTAVRGEALMAIKAVSRSKEVPMSVIGEDYHVVPDINGLRLVRPDGEARYDVAMAGHHQLDNAAVAVATLDALRRGGVVVPEAAVQHALAATRVPGRMESMLMPGEPHVEVLLDGAHNPAAAQSLRYHLGRIDWSGFHLVVGFNRDKPWRDLLGQWMPLAAHVWAVPLRSTRSLQPEEMAPAVEAAGFPFTACRDAADALRRAQAGGAQRIVVAGSLFLVGEARAFLTGEDVEEIRGSQ